jgi:hypothetical protein
MVRESLRNGADPIIIGNIGSLICQVNPETCARMVREDPGKAASLPIY